MKLTLKYCRELVRFSHEKRIAPISVYYLNAGNRIFILPAEREILAKDKDVFLRPFEMKKIKRFPIHIKKAKLKKVWRPYA